MSNGNSEEQQSGLRELLPHGDRSDGKTGVPAGEQGISNRPGDQVSGAAPQKGESDDAIEENDTDDDEDLDGEDDGDEFDDEDEDDEEDEQTDPQSEPGKLI